MGLNSNSFIISSLDSLSRVSSVSSSTIAFLQAFHLLFVSFQGLHPPRVTSIEKSIKCDKQHEGSLSSIGSSSGLHGFHLQLVVP